MTVISDVKKRVSKALAEDERTAEYTIDVVDDQGIVTLTGAVDSEAARDAAAAEIAEDIVTPPPDVRGGVRDV